jgi:putative acetyltransferase
MSELHIRHLEPADFEQIHALYADATAFADTLQPPYQTVQHWRQKLDPMQDGVVSLVALRGLELVGQLGIETSRNPRRRHVASFGMGVKASARGSGVGSALVTAAIDTCERWMNIQRIEIQVYADNAAAIALYRKHGFVEEGRHRDFAFRDGRYVDALSFARLLDPTRKP